MSLPRRRRLARWLLTTTATAIAIAVAGLWAFGIEPASLDVQRETLRIRGIPAGRALRVAVLTDLHVGSSFNGIDKLRRIVERTNANGRTSSAFLATW